MYVICGEHSVTEKRVHNRYHSLLVSTRYSLTIAPWSKLSAELILSHMYIVLSMCIRVIVFKIFEVITDDHVPFLMCEYLGYFLTSLLDLVKVSLCKHKT